MNTGRPEQYTGQVTAGPGGAMTDEVGVIAGHLPLTTSTRPNRRADVRIQYTGADEWYTLTGNPAPVPPDGLHVLHTRVMEAVRHRAQAVVPGE
ncbi:hypothetical protein [Streptomyces sp. NPDC056987]|uniref:hypothetical protein n=1 Tax=Streptomyces sp. NPDC056987 TaxID=3345988 RepID=UPI003630C3B4